MAIFDARDHTRSRPVTLCGRRRRRKRSGPVSMNSENMEIEVITSSGSGEGWEGRRRRRSGGGKEEEEEWWNLSGSPKIVHVCFFFKESVLFCIKIHFG